MPSPQSSKVGAGDQRPSLQIGARPKEEAVRRPGLAANEESVRSLESPGRPDHDVGGEHAVGPDPTVGGSLGSGIEPEPIALRLERGGEEPAPSQRRASSAPGSAHDSAPVFLRWRRYASGDSRKWHSVHCFAA